MHFQELAHHPLHLVLRDRARRVDLRIYEVSRVHTKTLKPHREVSVLCANTSTAVQMSALVRLFRFEQGGNQATALLTPGTAIQEKHFVDEFGNTCPITAKFLQPACCLRHSQ